MLKRILPLLLLLTPLAWGQAVVTTPIAQDITSNCTGSLNCWVPLPSQDCSNGLATSSDLTLGCLDSGGWPYQYNFSTRTWSKINTGLSYGGWAQIAIGSASSVWLRNASPGAIYQVVNGQLVAPSGGCCFKFLAVAGDGTLFGIGTGTTQISESNDGGKTWWTLPSTGWTSISAVDSVHMCATNTSSDIECWNGTAWGAPLGSPTAYASAANLDSDGNITLIGGTVGNSNVYIMDAGATGASEIYGKVATYIASFSVGSTLIVSGGQVYHLNRIAGGSSAHLSGNVNGCPPPGVCTPGTEHAGHVQTQVPNGLSGAMVTGETSPQNSMNLTSTDFSNGCDFLFGNGPSDPKCKPTASGSIFCPIAAAYLFTYPVQSITPCSVPISRRNGWWNSNATITVYFDGNFFTQGGNCPNTANALCDIFQGIFSWDSATSNNNKFSMGGVLAPAQICLSLSLPAPCPSVHPSFPWIMVTDATAVSNHCNAAAACSYGPINIPNGSQLTQEGVIGVSDVGFYQQNAVQYRDTLAYIGAHETGHTFGLDNCNGDSKCVQLGGAYQTAQTSVMWYTPVPTLNNLTGPSGCDLAWAAIAQHLFHH